MNVSHPDIEWCIARGTMAVRPSRLGRLSALVSLTHGGHDRVWVFKDTVVRKDDDGDERVDYLVRGIAAGSCQEGKGFLSLCARAGLVTQETEFPVPFSSGFTCAESERGLLMGWSDAELKLLRLDLPNQGQLERLLHRHEQSAAAALAK